MRLGIIGCGVLGRFHAPCAVKAGFQIVACADPVRANAEVLAAEYNAVVVEDAAGLCALANVDVVAICAPTHVHAKIVIAAPCFSGGKASSSTPWLEGCSPPPASPCSTRAAINTPRLVAIPQSAEASVNTAIDNRK